MAVVRGECVALTKNKPIHLRRPVNAMDFPGLLSRYEKSVKIRLHPAKSAFQGTYFAASSISLLIVRSRKGKTNPISPTAPSAPVISRAILLNDPHWSPA